MGRTKQPVNAAGLEQRQQAPLKHGAERSVKELQRGQPLTGPAQDAEDLVRAELANDGRAQIVENAAIRLEAVARMYYNAVQDAAEKNDLAKLDSYVKRFGWLQASALRAWAQQKQEQQDQDKVWDYELYQGDE